MAGTKLNFLSLFHASEGFSHLNAGTQTRTPIFALEEMQRCRVMDENNPTESFYRSYPRFWELQKNIAAYLGADPNDLFFRANITAAINDFVFSVPLKQGSEIVVSSWEYGAVSLLAKQRAEQGGYKFRVLELPEPGTEDILSYLEKNLQNPGLFIFSHVATGNGEILPVEKISALAQKRGAIVVVDGAHAIGALPISFSDLPNVDFYGGNFHKWFLGPKGTGFGWVHPKWRGKIPWNFGGWASFEVPGFYQNFGEGCLETAKRFFQGTIDPTPFWGLEKVLELWNKEEKNIRNSQQRLCELIAGEMGENFKKIKTSKGSPLLGYLAPKEWQKESNVELANRLYFEHKVQVALPRVQGQLLLRLSPGIYISENEAIAGVKALRDFQL